MHNLTQLNSYSATPVNYVDQGTGSQVLANRYQINGLLDTSKTVFENIEKICSTAGSWLSYDIQQGLWGVVINKSETAVASFDNSNILGSISISSTGLEDLYNAVNVEFPHRNLRDSADFVNIEIPSGDRNPNEPDNTLNISYDILNEPVQAQLLGFIELKQSRVDIIIRFETDYSYYGLSAGDVINVTNAQFGFVNKPFRIISIAEIQNEQGPLTLSISALEYSANVYNESDLYRYTRTDSTGIITIGSIGIPGTPTVTKIEQDARPRITVNAVSPTGIVEGIEFWLTEDVTVPVDANRSYTLISTQYPTGNNATFSSGTTVTFDYPNLQASDFLIKCRGFNTTTVGPFSSPSGLVNFDPVQVTNAINANTLAINSAGGLVTALSVLSLVQKVDTLFGNTANALGNTGIFSQVFDLFQDKTGYDLIGQTESGNLVVPAQITILDEGDILTNNVGSINFVGNNIVATNSGSDVTVALSGNVVVNVETYPRGISPGNAVIITGIRPGLTGAANIYGGIQSVGNWFTGNTTLTTGSIPPIRDSIVSDPVTANVNVVPATGSLWFNVPARIGWVAGSQSLEVNAIVTANAEYWDADVRPIVTPITTGGGSVRLYKSDGSLVQTLGPGDINLTRNLIELPFANRAPETDYYIKFDQDAIKYCNTSNVCIMTPSSVASRYAPWGLGDAQAPRYVTDILSGAPAVSNDDVRYKLYYSGLWPFSTGNSSVSSYAAPSAATLPIYNPPGFPPSSFGNVEIVSTNPASNETVTVGPVTLSMTVNVPTVTSLSGNVTVTGSYPNGSSTSQTLNLADATVSGNVVTFGTVNTLANGSFALSIPRNIATSTITSATYTDPMCGTLVTIPLAAPVTVTGPRVGPQIFSFNTFTNAGFFRSYSLVGTSLSEVRIRSRINLQFSGLAYPTTGNIKIYKASDNSLIQSIPVDEIYTRFPGSFVPQPGDDGTFGLIFPAVGGTESGSFGWVVNPTVSFEPNTSYYMLIDAGSFAKTGFTSWPGITSNTVITWTTTSN